MTTISVAEPLAAALSQTNLLEADVSDYLNAVFPQLMTELESENTPTGIVAEPNDGQEAPNVAERDASEPDAEQDSEIVAGEQDADAKHDAPIITPAGAYIPSYVEQWREAVGHPGYLVSDRGAVSGQRVATMVLSRTTAGYARVNLAGSIQSVARLVATAFCQRESEDKCQVDHINRNPADDRAINLRWVTISENCYNRDMSGTSNRARPIDQLATDGTFVATWPSISAAVIGTHLGRHTIEHSLNNTRATRHFKFRYHVDDDLPEEVWRTAIHNSTTVIVSNLGRVDVQGRKYFPRMASTGHCIHNNCGVHVYVATAFIENPEGRTVVLHRDNDRANNHVANLEWSTMSKITQHAADTGQNGKLRSVRQLTTEGQLVATFPSIAAASRATGASASHIGGNCREAKGRLSAGGYKWEFVEAD